MIYQTIVSSVSTSPSADYTPISGPLTWNDGDQPNKMIILELHRPSGGAVLNRMVQFIITIIDDMPFETSCAPCSGMGDPGYHQAPRLMNIDVRLFTLSRWIAMDRTSKTSPTERHHDCVITVN